jgi:hypothetical protein
MIDQLTSTSSSSYIIGYSDSKIAKSETNDCVVRSFASAFKVTYDESHQFVAIKFNRQNRRGTARFVPIMNNMASHNQILWGKTLRRVGNTNSKNSLIYMDNGKMRNMTTFQFLKKFPKGTYMVTVRQHAFTIHNGVVIGNHEDVLKTKKVILHAWEVCGD